MKRPESTVSEAARLWALGALGVIPALLLAGLAFASVRRERALAEAELQGAARERVGPLSLALHRALLEPGLPSRADIEAFVARPGAPEDEPVARVTASTGRTLALFVHAGGTYPDLADRPPTLRPFEPESLSAEGRFLWNVVVRQGADDLERTRSDRDRAWEQWSATHPGAEVQANARYRRGLDLLDQGRTEEARTLLEEVAYHRPSFAGETGLPLDLLSLRALLQLGTADPKVASECTRWLDALGQRALLQWRLPHDLILEWEFLDPARVRRWIEVARRHADSRREFRRMDAGGSFIQGPGPTPRWLSPGEAEPSDDRILTEHVVPGGRWWLLRTAEQVRQVIRQTLAVEGVPDLLSARISISGRSIVGSPSDAVMATGQVPEGGAAAVGVQLSLAEPGLLAARVRQRMTITATGVGLACLATLGGLGAVLYAYQRQRRWVRLQGDFVASVSHELRAPLASIRLLAEELGDLGPDDEATRSEYHRLLLLESGRLGRLVDNVLRHARLERGKGGLEKERINLNRVVESAAASFRLLCGERRIRLEAAIPESPIWTEADPQALHQVLVNLLDNAVKHSPSEGTVRIGIASDAVSDSPAGAKSSDAGPSDLSGATRIWVADEGPGIPALDRHRIFDAFVRLGSEMRRETAGVGLGLAIVRRIVEDHGGWVDVESRPGAGCRFVVELPGGSPRAESP